MMVKTYEVPTPQKGGTAEKAPGKGERKPWKKKSPVEAVLDQINRQRDDVARREEELKVARRQLQKLEEARKILEST